MEGRETCGVSWRLSTLEQNKKAVEGSIPVANASKVLLLKLDMYVPSASTLEQYTNYKKAILDKINFVLQKDPPITDGTNCAKNNNCTWRKAPPY